MSYADTVFKNTCRDILENGTDTQGELVRPIWQDTGEKAYTIKKFSVIHRYNLSKEFPAITLRPVPIKSATEELLWIYQKKSNNINDFSLHIWDAWADSTGSIGKAYGYQIKQKYAHHKIASSDELKFGKDDVKFYNYIHDYFSNINMEIYPSSEIYYEQKLNDDNKHSIVAYLMLDQIDAVIWDLKNNPYSRRIMTNTYNFKDLHEMNLYPCAYEMKYNVTKDKETGKLVLNGILIQRSQDVLAALAWNEVQYAVLLHIIAQCCDMIPGEFVHEITDCHIYDRHVPIIKELIEREEYPAPKFWLNPDIHNFYDFTKNDVKLIDYKHGPQIEYIPIAV